jgi:hypothetical protein
LTEADYTHLNTCDDSFGFGAGENGGGGSCYNIQ